MAIILQCKDHYKMPFTHNQDIVFHIEGQEIRFPLEVKHTESDTFYKLPDGFPKHMIKLIFGHNVKKVGEWKW